MHPTLYYGATLAFLYIIDPFLRTTTDHGNSIIMRGRFGYFNLKKFYYNFVPTYHKDDSKYIVEHENYCAKIQQTVFMHFVSTFVKC